MKIILIGYPGSQCIVPASKYLTGKYLRDFDITYLNYTGNIAGWAHYVRTYLASIPDEVIIFALDDYLIADYVDWKNYQTALAELDSVDCIKLCNATAEENNEYPVTTQYTLWKKSVLIDLLHYVYTPWQFEINGSQLFTKSLKKMLHRPCIDYFTNSSISSRWQRVKYDGLKQEDIDVITGNYGIIPALSQSKTVVFGGSGFLGTALIERLIKTGNENILAVARNEGALVALKEKFPAIEIMVGDIADRWVVKKAMQDAGSVFLLAAMKHVGLADIEVKSCISTNVLGCTNIIDESLITKPRTLVFISTDKAAQPTGVYGCSKKIGERLIIEAEKINPNTRYRIIRYGNVWGSTGSFITKWIPRMKNGEEIILTDPDASRFFWTVQEALDLIFECIEQAPDASPYIPKMKAIKMGDVLEACMDVYGKCPVKIIGLQPGENKVETTDGITFSDTAEQFTKEEFTNKFLCTPQ